LLLLGGIAFTSIDFTKFIYEDQIYEYMKSYVQEKRKRRFIYKGIICEKVGRIIGAFVSCLYVI